MYGLCFFPRSCGRSQTTVLFLNQLRSKIGVLFGNPEVTAGGNALKFYASVRLDIRRKEILKYVAAPFPFSPPPASRCLLFHRTRYML